MARAFPFAFFGAVPSDYRDGEQIWLARTHDPLSKADRQALASALANAERGTGTSVSRVLFADDQWLCLTARTSEAPTSEPMKLFADVATLLRALHAVTAIEEALCVTALGIPNGPWDAWTRSHRSSPSVVPLALEFPLGQFVERLDSRFYGDTYHRACAALPPLRLRRDPDFDAAYAGTSEAEEPSRALSRGQADVSEAEHVEHDERDEHDEQNDALGATVLELEEVDEPMSSYVPPPEGLTHPMPGWTKSASGRVVSRSTDGTPNSTLACAIEVLDPGAAAPRRFVPDFSLCNVAWTPDGTRLVATEHGRLHVVNLDDFSSRTVAWPREAPSAVFLDDERLVLSVAGALTLHRLGADLEPVEIDRLVAPRRILGAHLARYLVELNSDEPSVIYGFRGGRLALLGRFELERDADVFVRDGELRIENLEEDVVYRVVGL